MERYLALHIQNNSHYVFLNRIIQRKKLNQTLYGEGNSRTNKYDDNRNKETLYFNQYWVEHKR